MKIIVAGLAKTGTTGLFYQIKNSIEGEARVLFEEREYKSVAGDDQRPVLAKTLVGRPGYADFASFGPFDKKVCIIRDPRDRIISSLLYRSFGDNFLDSDECVARLVAMLHQKEEDTDSVSVEEIVRLQGELVGNPPKQSKAAMYAFNQPLQWIMDFCSEHPEYFVVKYEDFVLGKVDGLGEYLGFPLTGRAEVGSDLQRVVRTKQAGDWMNWFTASDIELFQTDPRMAEYMKVFDYEDRWELPERRGVNPSHGSEYLLRLLDERRRGAAPRVGRA